jgi:hypothetical protein
VKLQHSLLTNLKPLPEYFQQTLLASKTMNYVTASIIPISITQSSHAVAQLPDNWFLTPQIPDHCFTTHQNTYTTKKELSIMAQPHAGKEKNSAFYDNHTTTTVD